MPSTVSATSLRAEATPELSSGFEEKLAARLAAEPLPASAPAGAAEPAGGTAVAAPR